MRTNGGKSLRMHIRVFSGRQIPRRKSSDSSKSSAPDPSVVIETCGLGDDSKRWGVFSLFI